MVNRIETVGPPLWVCEKAGASALSAAQPTPLAAAAPQVQVLSPIGNARRALALAAVAAMAGCASRQPARAPAGGGTASAGPRTPPSPVPPTQAVLDLDPSAREASVAQAMLLVNTPYRYGGNTPEGGFDCSGLVSYVFHSVAVNPPRRLRRSTAQWAAATQPVGEAALQRGDLVFFNTTGAAFSHMGIFVGNGQFVHAPSTGGTVRKDAVGSRYFGPRYMGARRVFAA